MKITFLVVHRYPEIRHLGTCLDSISTSCEVESEVLCIWLKKPESIQWADEYLRRMDSAIIMPSYDCDVSKALNQGLVKASGDYILFLSSDEYLDEHAPLKQMIDIMESEQLNVCGGSIGELQRQGLVTDFSGLSEKKRVLEEQTVSFREYQYADGLSRFLFRRKYLLDNEIFFPDQKELADQLFLAGALHSAGMIRLIPERVSVARIYEQKKKMQENHLSDVLMGYRKLLHYSSMNDYKDFESNSILEFGYRWLPVIEKSVDLYSVDFAGTLRAYAEEINTEEKPVSKICTRIINTADLIEFLHGRKDYPEGSGLFYAEQARQQLYNHEFLPAVKEDTNPLKQADISVVMPVYNIEEYLRDSIRSILTQTEVDLELICVNDGSDDDSLQILLEIAKGDVRVHVFSQTNEGVSAARNLGASHAAGKYLYFMDGDDILQEGALSQLFKTAEENRLDILYFDGNLLPTLSESDPQFLRFDGIYNRRQLYSGLKTGKEMMREFLQNEEYLVNVNLQFFRTSFYNMHQLKFYPGIIHEDNLFTFEAMLSADRVMHTPLKLFLRRLRPNSIMTKKISWKNALGYFICYEKMTSFLKGKDFSKDEYFVAGEIVKRILQAVKRNYKELNEQERSFYWGLPLGYRITFQQMVVNVVEMEERNKNSEESKKKEVELRKRETESKRKAIEAKILAEEARRKAEEETDLFRKKYEDEKNNRNKEKESLQLEISNIKEKWDNAVLEWIKREEEYVGDITNLLEKQKKDKENIQYLKEITEGLQLELEKEKIERQQKEQELNDLNKVNEQAHSEIRTLKANYSRDQERNKKEIDKLKRRNESLLQSKDFRLGHLLLIIPRKIKKMLGI